MDRIGPRARAPLIAAAAVIVALIASALAPGATPAPLDRFRVTFLDVGQGDATLLQAPGGVAVLVDGGPPESGVVGKLRAAGVRSLDLVVLTHAQEDHQGGLENVVEELPVGAAARRRRRFARPDARRIVSLARRRGARIVAPGAGQILRAGALRLRVLHPSGEPVDPDDEPNHHAIVMLASYRGTDVFLPADAESNVTAALQLTDVEVLKVAHHGSEDEGIGSLLRRLRSRAGGDRGRRPQQFRPSASGDAVGSWIARSATASDGHRRRRADRARERRCSASRPSTRLGSWPSSNPHT